MKAVSEFVCFDSNKRRFSFVDHFISGSCVDIAILFREKFFYFRKDCRYKSFASADKIFKESGLAFVNTHRNATRNNGAILRIQQKAAGLTPKMSDTLRKLADFTVSEADNQPDSLGWTDVPGRYRETLDDIRDAYERHVTTF